MAKRTGVRTDDDMSAASILKYFAKVPDPRIDRARLHPLTSVLVLSICAVICGADSFVSIEYFGTARKEWLKTFLDLPHGIPSHDTIGRIFAMLNPKALERAFRDWATALSTLSKGEVVAIDGKTLRRSFKSAGSGAFVHMVSAWAAGNQMVLGQVKTEEKANEITAIPHHSAPPRASPDWRVPGHDRCDGLPEGDRDEDHRVEGRPHARRER